MGWVVVCVWGYHSCTYLFFASKKEEARLDAADLDLMLNQGLRQFDAHLAASEKAANEESSSDEEIKAPPMSSKPSPRPLPISSGVGSEANISHEARDAFSWEQVGDVKEVQRIYGQLIGQIERKDKELEQ